MTFLRSSVMDIPAAAMSHLPVDRSWPDLMPSKGVSTMVCSTPSFLATRSIMSTSNPIVLPWSSFDWNGAYGRWVQVVILPEAMSVTPAAAAPPLVAPEPPPAPPEPPDEPELQAARPKAAAAATTRRERDVEREVTAGALLV